MGAHTPPPAETFDGGKTLSKIIDKGFPYDDGDNSIEDQTPKWSKKKTETPINVGKLNGENVTKQALVALVKDTDAPITQGLVQLDEMKSDADGLFKLMDANVTRGNLKNLVTDKPSPITVGLAQTSDNSLAQGVPVHVNPVLARDTMGDAKLDMKILVGPDDVELKKKAKK